MTDETRQTTYAIERGQILIREPMDDGENWHIRQIPLEALGSWAELLGIDSPSQVLDAIVHVQDHGEPEPDPDTGDNVWTGPYLALAEREQARQREQYLAEHDGTRDDPRSPLLRSRLAAFASADPVAEAQATARARLGIPDPRPAARAAIATAALAAELDPLAELKAVLDGELAPDIEERRGAFLATLTPGGAPA